MDPREEIRPEVQRPDMEQRDEPMKPFRDENKEEPPREPMEKPFYNC